MATCKLPYWGCSQKFYYENDLGHKQTAMGLRIDLREWINDRCGKNVWGYVLEQNQVVFTLPNRGVAASLILCWYDAIEIHSDPPVPRLSWDKL